SFTVNTVTLYNNDKDLTLPCVRCNTVATIVFRDHTFKLPHVLSDELLTIVRDYSISSISEFQAEKLIFSPKNQDFPMLLQMNNQHSAGLFLLTLYSYKSQEKQKRLLSKIRLHQ